MSERAMLLIESAREINKRGLPLSSAAVSLLFEEIDALRAKPLEMQVRWAQHTNPDDGFFLQQYIDGQWKSVETSDIPTEGK